ncbi:1-acyl-sn-glycerol-3-phosphate acyltransferase [bacterium]|nr:MAG: 1-acyl-sn-glycerol-3-phosphate acyltransferase [bacterium]
MNAQRLADLLAILARLFCGATLRVAEDAAPVENVQRVYIPNHSSHLDFVVLWSALPRRLRRVTRPVAARDYWQKTALRRFLSVHVYRAILIEREHVSVHSNPIEQIMVEMGDDSLILFPEGTRGSGDEIGAFKSGVYHLAHRKPDLQYVPVYIENLNRVLPKGEILPLPLLCSITLGPPLQLEEGESKAAFLTRLRDAVVALKENTE